MAAFGGAGLLVIAGAASPAVIGGGAGEIVAMVLIGLGFVVATSLVFLEVGLSEDRERARSVPRRSERHRLSDRPRLDRMRGRPRRLG